MVSVCLYSLSNDIRTCVHAHRRGPSCLPGGSKVPWAVGNVHFLVGCDMDVNRQQRRGAIYKTKHKNHESHEVLMKIKGKSSQNVGSAWQRR